MLLLLLGQGPPTLGEPQSVCQYMTALMGDCPISRFKLELFLEEPLQKFGFSGKILSGRFSETVSQFPYLFVVKWVVKTEKDPVGGGRRQRRGI